MKANERLKIMKAINDAIEQYETIPHKTTDITYYDALYKLHQAEIALSNDLDNYLKKA